MENEEWRDVVGYEGIYQVSNLGRVKRIKTRKGACAGKILCGTNRSGYKAVILYNLKKRSRVYIHRLVSTSFIPNPENKPQIDHIDGNRHNNRADNLRWCSVKENANNPVTLSRLTARMRAKPPYKGKLGKLHHGSTPIICVELQKLFWGTGEASRQTNVRRGSIHAAITGRYKTAGGYHWRYATPEEIK